MLIEIFKESDKQKWNDFVATAPDGGLLQSWEWGEFQTSLGRKTWRLAFLEADKIIGAALIIKYPLPLGKSYFYIPRGPIIKNQGEKLEIKNRLEGFIKKIKEIAKKEGVIFLRIEPPFPGESNQLIPILRSAGFRKTKSISPQETLIIDLSRSENELLAAMHPKTRYNLRLAQKKKIIIEETIDPEQIKFLYKMLEETAARDKIGIFPKNHYQKMLAVLGEKGILKLFLAKIEASELDQNKSKFDYLAGILVSFFGDFATYLHGASSNKRRNLMAPYLLQWQAILEGKKQNKKYYDFYGVSSTNKKWAGITRFKMGFSQASKITSLPGTFEFPLNKIWYLIYQIGKKIKL